tara:strand:- start:5120 stop:6337 length:1218 start_codon:yes stop_codon:yes gene_type:complete
MVGSFDINKEEKSIKDLYIFGCGAHGQILYMMLSYHGYKIKGFLDNSTERIDTFVCGAKVISPTDISDKASNIIIGSVYIEAMIKQLEELGLRNIFLPTDIFKHIRNNPMKIYGDRSTDDIEREISLYLLEIDRIESKGNQGNLNIKSLDLVVTERCTLKCQDCSNLMQYYKSPVNADIDLMISSMIKLFEVGATIGELRIIGGEPFVNRDIDKLLRFLNERQENHGKTIVYTNGTIIPSKSTTELLKNLNAFIDISNYGELSRRYGELVSHLDKNNINHSAKELKWTDSGRILEKPHESLHYVEKLYANCCTRDVFTLMHGMIFHCPFSANLYQLSTSDKFQYEGIDLKGNTKDELLLTNLREFVNNTKYLMACYYCNGRDFSTPYIPVAQQTRKPIEVPDSVK